MSFTTEKGTGGCEGEGDALEPIDGEAEAVTPGWEEEVGVTVLRAGRRDEGRGGFEARRARRGRGIARSEACGGEGRERD